MLHLRPAGTRTEQPQPRRDLIERQRHAQQPSALIEQRRVDVYKRQGHAAQQLRRERRARRGVQPAGHFGDAVRGARDDEALLRARHGLSLIHIYSL